MHKCELALYFATRLVHHHTEHGSRDAARYCPQEDAHLPG